ncbi:MAG: V-type ATP synthase subunit I [Clostridiales bacterium]|nr:V-type ATP synthase subunit I [Clostridiales bacterium]
MAIVDMKKVFLIGLQADKEKILDILQRMGNVEIVEISHEENQGDGQGQGEDNGVFDQYYDYETLERIESQLAEIEFALKFIGRYCNKKRGAFTSRQSVSVAELEQMLRRADGALQVAATCRKLEQQLVELGARETRILSVKQQLLPWKGLDLPLEDIGDTASTRVLVGTLDSRGSLQFEDAIKLEFADREFFVQRVGENREQVGYLVIYHKALEQEIDPKLKEFGFSHVNFSNMEGTPAEIIDSCDNQLSAIMKERQRIEEEARELEVRLSELEVIYDGLSILRDKKREAMKLLSTEKTFVLKGWVPAADAENLTNKLNSAANAIYIQLEDPEPGESFPVALENPPLVQPFEVVTELYSTPDPRSIDPNPYMAPFFFVFFGVMMGDAGYGLIIAALSYFALRKLKLKGMGKKLGMLIFLGGISCIIWGTIFGGWFGNAGALLGLPPLWFDPINEPLAMLIFCFALGLIQIFVGMGLKAYMNIRRGKVWDAVFDQGLWYVTIIGLIIMATISQTVGQYMALAGAIGLVLTQGRHQKNIVKRLFSGLLSLYDITGYFSDMLSYSRLFALALSGGVIATVINQLGLMAANSWIGWIVAAVVLAAGHGFNILISILGAYVHTSRLQYIEFFGRFFEAGGSAFRPLRIKTKFIDVYQEEEAV